MAIIGIDLGTSNSAAAVLRGGRPVIIPSAEGGSPGGKAFPSYVALTAAGQVLVGEPARRQAAANPEGTVSAFKRRMGQRANIRLRDREYSPEQLSAFLLQKIKRDAEAFLGESVAKAVVTVPAYFDDNQRSATRDACRIAGLEVLRLVNEPTAAALAYGLGRLGQALRIVVIDLGGGTLDVTFMAFGKGVFEVKATSGDTQLGGTDMNQRVFEHLAERIQLASGIDVRKDRKAVARLLEVAEAAKIELSSNITTHISLPYLAVVNGEPYHLELDIKRNELDRLVHPLIERCRGPVEQAMHDAGVTPRDIDRVLFVGGPTRMPAVRSFFEKLFVRKAEMGVDPMECVAAGAAIQAGVLAGTVGGITLVDVTPLTLGIETLAGVATPLIARNTPLPVQRSEIFTTAADMQSSVTVHVFQGERPMAHDNTSLGEFNLDGLPPAPRGVPKVEVSFDIDANGLLSVAAKDAASGKTQAIRISASTRLSEEDKKRMEEEAERYADADKQRRVDAENLNAADAACYEAEKMLVSFADQLDDDLKQRIGSALHDAREVLLKKEVQVALERVDALKDVLQEAGTALYSPAVGGEGGLHAQPNVGDANGEARPSGSGPRGKIVDADYEDRS